MNRTKVIAFVKEIFYRIVLINTRDSTGSWWVDGSGCSNLPPPIKKWFSPLYSFLSYTIRDSIINGTAQFLKTFQETKQVVVSFLHRPS